MLVPARSLIWLASAVTVHVVPAGNAAPCVSVIWAVPVPASVTVCATALHETVNAGVVRFTALSKLTTIDAVARTEVAPLTGTVVVTTGGVSTVMLIVFESCSGVSGTFGELP